MSSDIYSVREITERIQGLLEDEFPFIWVRGEVGGLSRPASGHVYFSLKDADATLAAVWFKRSRMRRESGIDPLTGEVMLGGAGGLVDPADVLAEGQEVLCGGRITVYPPRGAYQLRVELVQDMGEGRLHLEFEALKQKFAALGYFDMERKRSLPHNPLRVAVVTAPTGAAIRDFLRLAGERGFGSHIRIYPTLVQGDSAEQQIADAIKLANEQDWAQVIVLIRGGGSLEDLWAFNTEGVAEAVFSSTIPVLAGVGHEVDVSIADMVADLRAATPSHAAQLLWPERFVLEQEVDGLDMGLARAMWRILDRGEERLSGLEHSLRLLSPSKGLDYLQERLEQAGERLGRAMAGLLQRKTSAWEGQARLFARAFGPWAVESRANDVEILAKQLTRAGGQRLRDTEREFEKLALRLEAANPEAPLERGYSLVRSKDTGKLVKSIREVAPGQGLDIRVRDGDIAAEVTDTTSDA
ncbi:MAG: exodeoxyribonuclease VII large subunit [Desulfovibrio sp.]|nr:MAG: exodeoxyribonuclease VII large subunit [Desulfovibrio sp.]